MPNLEDIKSNLGLLSLEEEKPFKAPDVRCECVCGPCCSKRVKSVDIVSESARCALVGWPPARALFVGGSLAQSGTFSRF
jgi:hypothetical protein